MLNRYMIKFLTSTMLGDVAAHCNRASFVVTPSVDEKTWDVIVSLKEDEYKKFFNLGYNIAKVNNW